MFERGTSGYISKPSSQAFDEHCTPVAELNFKRFPQVEADGSHSEDKQKLWSLACAFTDIDEDEIIKVLTEETSEEASDVEDSEDSGQDNGQDEEDSDTETIAREIFSQEFLELENDDQAGTGTLAGNLIKHGSYCITCRLFLR